MTEITFLDKAPKRKAQNTVNVEKAFKSKRWDDGKKMIFMPTPSFPTSTLKKNTTSTIKTAKASTFVSPVKKTVSVSVQSKKPTPKPLY